MSILKYFQRKQPRDYGDFLPEASKSLPLLSERSISSANEELRVIADTIAPVSKRQKTEQHFYSEEVRASIGKYASVHGPTNCCQL